RYLARKYGFLPADLKQAALQEQVHDLMADVGSLLVSHIQSKSEEDKAEFFTKFEVLLETLIKIQTKLLKDNGSTGRHFGDSLSYADIISYGFYMNLMVNVARFKADIADVIRPKLTSELVKLFTAVESDPLVKNHKSRGGSLAAVASA
ncbi:hypothetical protein GGF43_004577, partial [Coemansia sp. RSA 2618]